MLDKDVTLRDLWKRGELRNAMKYLDRLFVRYREISRDVGECCIRIGITGSGHAPNYRVQPIHERELEHISHRLARTEPTEEQIEDDKYLRAMDIAYNGRSHLPISLDVGARDPANWSDPPMSYGDFIKLINDVTQTDKAASKARRR